MTVLGNGAVNSFHGFLLCSPVEGKTDLLYVQDGTTRSRHVKRWMPFTICAAPCDLEHHPKFHYFNMSHARGRATRMSLFPFLQERPFRTSYIIKNTPPQPSSISQLSFPFASKPDTKPRTINILGTRTFWWSGLYTLCLFLSVYRIIEAHAVCPICTFVR